MEKTPKEMAKIREMAKVTKRMTSKKSLVNRFPKSSGTDGTVSA